MEGNVQTKDVDPEHVRAYKEVLADAIAVVDEEDVSYLVAGSLASATWGRPGSLGDIDLLIDPRDAKNLLAAFGKHGFDTEETEPRWIYKARKDGITVDLIFELSGPLYLEPQMAERGRVIETLGTKLRLMSPEDFVISQALALKEDTPDYWFNAMGVIARTPLEWDYVVEMSARGPKKILAFLMLATSEDLPVPDAVIRRIYEKAYGS